MILCLCTQLRPISGEMGREREHLHSLESSGAKFRRHLQKNSPREHPSLFSHSSWKFSDFPKVTQRPKGKPWKYSKEEKLFSTQEGCPPWGKKKKANSGAKKVGKSGERKKKRQTQRNTGPSGTQLAEDQDLDRGWPRGSGRPIRPNPPGPRRSALPGLSGSPGTDG